MMLFRAHTSRIKSFDIPGLSSYCSSVRAAHALADLLKRTRPHLHDQVDELQANITRCQERLDEAKTRIQKSMAEDGAAPTPLPSSEVIDTLKELDSTVQALLDLRHKGQMAR